MKKVILLVGVLLVGLLGAQEAKVFTQAQEARIRELVETAPKKVIFVEKIFLVDEKEDLKAYFAVKNGVASLNFYSKGQTEPTTTILPGIIGVSRAIVLLDKNGEVGKVLWSAPGTPAPNTVSPRGPATGNRTPPANSSYLGTGSGHWIQEVSSNGRLVTLEDGSLWEISSLDQIHTALWLPITDIVVRLASSAVGDYRYVLMNKEDGEQVLAKYLGTQ